MSGPPAGLRALDRLVGTWTLGGDTSGTVRYAWLPGGSFLLQHVDMVHGDNHIQGLEVIGHLKPFGEARSPDIHSRFYAASGDTLDYVYDLSGDTLTIWGGWRGSPASYTGTFSPDGRTCAGRWTFPGGGGYASTMTRVDEPE